MKSVVKSKSFVKPMGRKVARPLLCIYTMALTLILMHLAHAEAAPATSRDNAVKSNGCGNASTLSGLLKRTATDGNRKTRSYQIELPEKYDSSRAYPLFFVIHGAGGGAYEKSGGLRDVSNAAESVIFVYPQGIPFKNLGIGWDDSSNGYDMPFFDNMLLDVSANFCVDTSRVFLKGFSWGGDFVVALACTRGDKIRAAVAMSTTDEYSDNGKYQSYQNYPCPGRKHPAILYMHAVNGDDAYPPPLFKTTSNLFKYLNSCASAGHVVPPATTAMACVTYDSCSADYKECFIDHRVGHAQPPDWPKTAWEFLSQF